MAFVVIYSVVSGSLNGVEEVWGLGLALLGLVLSFISSRVGKARFYSDPSVSHGDTVEAELAGPLAGPGPRPASRTGAPDGGERVMAGAPVNDVMEAVYAGLDLGTSGCKGVLVTGDGRVVARAAARYPTHRPEPGAAEQHPGTGSRRLHRSHLD